MPGDQTMRSIFTILTLAASMSALIGCESWTAGSEYNGAVFSDDGQGVAAVRHSFDQKDKVTHTAKKNFSSQVLMKETTSSIKPSELTDPMPGRTIDLFYMRSAGNLILGRETEKIDLPDGSKESGIYYDYITMDGTVTPLGGGTYLTSLSCDGGTSYGPVSPPLRVIPSPDGSVLARFEAQTSCETRSQSVSFLDAHSLEVIGGPFTIPELPQLAANLIGSGWPTLDIGWTSTGQFAAAYWGSGATFASLIGTLFKAGQAPQKNVTMGTTCFYPPTSSSEVRADGTAVSIDNDSGAIQLTTSVHGGAQGVFGCN